MYIYIQYIYTSCASDEPQGGTKLSAAKWARLRSSPNTDGIRFYLAATMNSESCLGLSWLGKTSLPSSCHFFTCQLEPCQVIGQNHPKTAIQHSMTTHLAWGIFSTAALSDARYHLVNERRYVLIRSTRASQRHSSTRGCDQSESIAPRSWRKLQVAFQRVRTGQQAKNFSLRISPHVHL